MGDNERNPPFNMAVATLMRLDSILKEIKNLHYLFPVDCASKQRAHISLVKDFFINAVPLLGDNETTYSEKILDFKMTKRLVVIGGRQRYVEVFDNKKEKLLNELLSEMQLKLKRYFMPSADDDDDDY